MKATVLKHYFTVNFHRRRHVRGNVCRRRLQNVQPYTNLLSSVRNDVNMTVSTSLQLNKWQPHIFQIRSASCLNAIFFAVHEGDMF
uniref:Uncharacterized protein n=1 Tax=Arion vulgaris TaxID=1028688 RepID=A0A0B7A8U9_9EUPU